MLRASSPVGARTVTITRPASSSEAYHFASSSGNAHTDERPTTPPTAAPPPALTKSATTIPPAMTGPSGDISPAATAAPRPNSGQPAGGRANFRPLPGVKVGRSEARRFSRFRAVRPITPIWSSRQPAARAHRRAGRASGIARKHTDSGDEFDVVGIAGFGGVAFLWSFPLEVSTRYTAIPMPQMQHGIADLL